jgi:hypothetical protein
LDIRGAIFLFHRRLQSALHVFGFAPEHRGLVSDSNCLQMNIWIEARGVGPFEFLQKLRFVPAKDDVIADIICLRER